jgi:hypothetical protein
MTARLALLLGTVALPFQALAAETAKPCLEAAEAQAMLQFMLPETIDALSDQCRPVLPADATLTRSGHALAERYRPAADGAWPMAKVAFGKMSDPAMLKLLDDATIQKVFKAGMTAQIPKTLPTKDCGTVDRFITALEPLPAKNMAMLLGSLIELGTKTEASGRRASPLNLCPQLPTISTKGS